VDLSGVLHPDVIFQVQMDAATYFEGIREGDSYD